MQGSVASDSLRPCGLQGAPGSSVHGIFQTRILEWVAISFCRESFRPRDRTHISYIAGGFFTTVPPGWFRIPCNWVLVLTCPIAFRGTPRSVSAQSPPSSFHFLLLTLESSSAASSGGSCFSPCPSHLMTCSLAHFHTSLSLTLGPGSKSPKSQPLDHQGAP